MAWQNVQSGGPSLARKEFLVTSAADVADIPECEAGSVAYTADFSYIAMYNGTEWVQIGG